jgi:hypothetical protein
MMKAAKLTFATLLAAITIVSAAHADPANYGIESVGGALSSAQAGAHPDFTTSLTLKTEGGELPATTQNVTFELPQGFVANPNAVPKCSAAQFVNMDVEVNAVGNGCPQDAQVGVTRITFANSHEGTTEVLEPVFNLVPRVGEPARLGFFALTYPILIDTELRPDYGVTARVRGADSLASLYRTETTLWGIPASPSHDSERLTPFEAAHNRSAIDTPTGTRQSSLSPVPFMLGPIRCGEPFLLRASVTSYQEPNRLSEGSTFISPATGCSLLDFSPSLVLAPTTARASSSTGLDVDLTFPTKGLEEPNLLGEDEQKRVEVTLPEGMTVNPSQAQGLGACSEAAFARETASWAPGVGCPQDSKIGTVSARTPLLDEEATGSIYVATPHANPFGSLIAIYMVLRVPQRGVVVKLPGRVAADPETGQLTTTFGESPFEIPQLPVSEFHLHFREGARAPLVTPPRCGEYEASAVFTSWGGHVVTTHPTFTVSGDCPAGNAAFTPSFEAGAISNNAATFSPFFLRFSRSDSDQELTRFSATLPPGEVAKLAGVQRCSVAAIEAAKGRMGTDEQANPSCPASTRIGHILAGAGVGPSLTYVPGDLYLAGAYHGSPLSVVAIVPAVAGPFDLGTVVTQETLGLDPLTGRAIVDGSSADPLPHILQGIPLHLRDVRVYVDRPEFTLNPTACDPLATDAVLGGSGPDPRSSSDDVLAPVSAQYQAANCSRLRFAPRLSLRLKGGNDRSSYPALRAVLQPRKGDANIAFVQVALPHSEFLAQEHINTICTRVQFAAGTCPKGAIYGHARAFSPLLDQPLEGAVYLRSSSHRLPDLVIDLHGDVRIVLVGRIDSFRKGIRTTFAHVPDAPVSKFVLSMRGGDKGLLVNSTNICSSGGRAFVTVRGQNGRQEVLHPQLDADCRQESVRKR